MNKISAVSFCCLLLLGAAFPEVADSAANGFTIKITTNIHAAPAEVYQRILRVSEWWNSAHTFSGSAQNLSMEERAGGCFCEKLPNGGSVRHLQVVFVQPGKMLRLYGGLGPLQAMAATGPMTFSLAAADSGTRLDLSYIVTGYFAESTGTKWPPAVDKVLSEQITRLKNYIETGNPAGNAPQQKH